MQAFARRIVGDDRQCPALLEQAADGIAIVSGIGNQKLRSQKADQFRRNRRIATMARPDDQLPWTAIFINGCVDFGGSAAARAANGLRFSPPPFPPAAQR
jgi:hypothetical protein